MWLLIWVVLVLASLAGAFFLFRDLWVKFRQIPKSFSRTLGQMDEVMASVGERTEARQAAEPPIVNALVTDPVDLVLAVENQRAARFARKMHRRRPRPEVFARWLSIYR